MSHPEQLLKSPFSLVIAGPSKAGKTVFTSKLLQHIDSMCTTRPTRILWFFSEYQPAYRHLATMSRVQLKQGLPIMSELRADTETPKLIILDDLMHDVKGSPEMSQLFTKGVHHWNISCVFIVQNLFFCGRTARVNCQYLTLFKSPSDKLQVSILARQMYPKQSKFFLEAFEEATEKPYTYLFIDMSQDCPEELRLRTNIFPGEVTMVYAP